MSCIGTIDAGHHRPGRSYFFSLILSSADRIEPKTGLAGNLGFTDIFGSPVLGTALKNRA
jgi:hypothetical protein